MLRMKFKVIDLLNAIAEGKELPEKFMYKGHLYYRQKTKGICYRCDELNEIFEECLVLEDLNDTIEIIEETKKIEKIARCDSIKMTHYGELYKSTENEEILRIKINELIDEINNLKEK